jgi:hypothetical protein
MALSFPIQDVFSEMTVDRSLQLLTALAYNLLRMGRQLFVYRLCLFWGDTNDISRSFRSLKLPITQPDDVLIQKSADKGAQATVFQGKVLPGRSKGVHPSKRNPSLRSGV